MFYSFDVSGFNLFSFSQGSACGGGSRYRYSAINFILRGFVYFSDLIIFHPSAFLFG